MAWAGEIRPRLPSLLRVPLRRPSPFYPLPGDVLGEVRHLTDQAAGPVLQFDTFRRIRQVSVPNAHNPQYPSLTFFHFG
jgi:hypothetical protein